MSFARKGKGGRDQRGKSGVCSFAHECCNPLDKGRKLKKRLPRIPRSVANQRAGDDSIRNQLARGQVGPWGSFIDQTD